MGPDYNEAIEACDVPEENITDILEALPSQIEYVERLQGQHRDLVAELHKSEGRLNYMMSRTTEHFTLQAQGFIVLDPNSKEAKGN